MTERIVDTPLEGDSITEDGVPNAQFHGLLMEYERLINLLSPIIGTGSPEGSVEGVLYQTYLDTAGASGSRRYTKITDGGDTGWVLD